MWRTVVCRIYKMGSNRSWQAVQANNLMVWEEDYNLPGLWYYSLLLGILWFSGEMV